MVKVLVTASVKVTGGPTLPVSTTLEPTSYTFGSVELSAAGGDGDSDDLPLLPDGGEVAFLALNVVQDGGRPGRIDVKAVNGTTEGATVAVDGALFVSGPGLLVALVAGGPRTLTLTNLEDGPVTVAVLTGLDV